MVYPSHSSQNELFQIQGNSVHQVGFEPADVFHLVGSDIRNPCHVLQILQICLLPMSDGAYFSTKAKHSPTPGPLHFFFPLPGSPFLLIPVHWLPHFPWVLAQMSPCQEGTLTSGHQIAPVDSPLLPDTPHPLCLAFIFFTVLTPKHCLYFFV